LATITSIGVKGISITSSSKVAHWDQAFPGRVDVLHRAPDAGNFGAIGAIRGRVQLLVAHCS